MREIKFRAWNGQAMEYGGFSVHASRGDTMKSGLSSLPYSAPLMQYTGLNDQNGKEIYEGDIINGVTQKAIIIYSVEEAAYGFKEDGEFFERLGAQNYNEDCYCVIGNIHEA